MFVKSAEGVTGGGGGAQGRAEEREGRGVELHG
jgi:hypothetical protein